MGGSRRNEEWVAAVVGRPNVGKSALFNRLAGRRVAIVHDEPGVTRDRIMAPARGSRIPVMLVDTGGIGSSLDDGFAAQVAAEAEIAVETADLILLVVDGKDGMTPVDQSIGRLLRKAGKPVVLVVNKIDEAKHEGRADDFAALGFADPVRVSAEHGRGCEALLRRMEKEFALLPERLAEAGEEGERQIPLRLALLGRPNAGKSSLVNAILGRARTLVSETPGTTRDAVDIACEVLGRPYVLIDTAGIRRRMKMDSPVEVFSVMRAEKSVHRSDVCALVLDSVRGVAHQDRRIARTILAAGKPCLMVATKFDLYHPGAPYRERVAQLEEEVRRELFFLSYAPFVAVSAKQGDQMSRIFHGIDRIRKASAREITTGVLNRTLAQALAENPPPMRKGKRLKILYAAAARSAERRPAPVPHFILFVNDASLWTDDYRRYVEGRLRERNPFPGLPIRFSVRGRPPRETGKRSRASPSVVSGVRNAGSRRPKTRDYGGEGGGAGVRNG
ncbi:MAG TPA: ribosome biogenesis GTPase Der [Verrucomicrobiales bacterium]|nr:ribosome biogenesis GTPase Der [Verrucomicrobiales bacterium]